MPQAHCCSVDNRVVRRHLIIDPVTNVRSSSVQYINISQSQLVLQLNNFSFSSSLYLQIKSVARGTGMDPSHVCLYLEQPLIFVPLRTLPSPLILIYWWLCWCCFYDDIECIPLRVITLSSRPYIPSFIVIYCTLTLGRLYCIDLCFKG